MNEERSSRRLQDDSDPSGLGPDLTDCDREPIHIPGAVQPHGLLLVADAASRCVIAGAGDIESRLAADWLGRPLGELLGSAADRTLAAAGDDAVVGLGRLDATPAPLEAAARLSGGRWLVQLEAPSVDWSDPGRLLAWLDRAGAAFERASDLLALCDCAAGVFRELTGFDRVMIYRFLDDEAGVVVAEDRDPALGSFLNHHFPASDVPRQARALYVRNRVRVIPDVDYRPRPLRPLGAGFETLDLSDVDCRSVSPIHLQYLKNMGVAASASMSIVKDGVLWGMVACHHRSPRHLSYGERLASGALAGGLARQIRAKEEAEDYRQRLHLRAAEDVVIARLLSDAPLHAILAENAEDLRLMLDADGFAVIQGASLHCAGRCPDISDVREVAAWTRKAGAGQVVSTRALSERFPPAAAYRDLASGFVAVTLSSDEPLILLWFRAELLEVVNWAGNPHKAVQTEAGRLTPRASFGAWSEEVRGQARPWSLPQIDAAQRLTRALYDARQTRRMRELNRELGLALADKESLLVQKDYLIKEVNHRVQNSLQLVSAFLAMQAKADEQVRPALVEAQRRLAAVSLVHRRLYADDNVERVNLARYLEDLTTEMKASLGPDWAASIATDFAPILAPADVAVNVGLILTELVINANKYAYGGAAGPVSIVLEQHRNRLRLIVADKGQGKAGDREGFGSRMLNAIVRQLNGTLDESGNGPGLRVIMTAPIVAQTDGASSVQHMAT